MSSILQNFWLPNATTWFYFSVLLAVALFFKFSRLLSVRNWDVQAGTSRVGIEQSGLISAVAWSPDGQLLASAGEEGLVLVWRAADGDLLRRFERTGPVMALCWSPDGEQLVSGAVDGEKGTLSIWDVRQGLLVRTAEGHRGFIWDLDWSADHELLVSAPSTDVKVALALVPRVVMAVMQTTTIRASITAYSTAVGPSSACRKRTTAR